MNRCTRLSTLALFAALVVGGSAATAGPMEAQVRRGGAPDRQNLEREIEARFGRIVARELQLDGESQAALAGVLRSFDERRRDIARRKRAIQVRLGGRASLDPARGGSALLPDEEAARILDEMRRVRGDEQALMAEEEEALMQVLSVPQLVRFLTLRDAFNERARRALQGAARGPGEPGGGRRDRPGG